ncbi:MAG: Asp-tRNA(Asn)/Glu-tRNA(Gln) amidotransferase subunit GatB [Candidatus Paceibacterota bacterium]
MEDDKKYFPTIGLEIHAELSTKTRMFCNSKNNPDEKEPNMNVCPICLGHPGTLPTINREAVKHVLKVGLAVDGELADFTEFDRKNYFYPDIPKGYQISQYKFPLVKGGELAGVKLTRVHLEEDTARSTHETGNFSLVDFNRAGVPLMELVTEPVIHSAEEAGQFARELQLLLRTLGVSEANMEKGEMRVEANISVSDSLEVFGTKVEVKNLNSFKSVEQAIAFELDRHIKIIKKGEKLVQETRGWDEDKSITFPQRVKEDSHDYRYFPDPDLPKLKLSELQEFSVVNLKKEIPELPSEKRTRYAKDFGLKTVDIENLISNFALEKFFSQVLADFGADVSRLAALAANYLLSDLQGLIKKNDGSDDIENILAKIGSKNFSDLIRLIAGGEVSSRGGKDVLALMFKEGGEPKSLAEKLGVVQKSDLGALDKIVKEVVKNNPQIVADFKAGKTASVQFLIGQGMKLSKGSANPKILSELLQKELN